MVTYLTTLARQLGTSPGDAAEVQKLLETLDEVESGPAPVTQPKPLAHTVTKGDTLWSIAGEDTARVKQILAKKPGLDPAKLAVGQKVNL